MQTPSELVRRQWSPPCLTQLRVTGDTGNDGSQAHPNNLEWEGGCPPSHPSGGIGNNFINYRSPTSSEVGRLVPHCQ